MAKHLHRFLTRYSFHNQKQQEKTAEQLEEEMAEAEDRAELPDFAAMSAQQVTFISLLSNIFSKFTSIMFFICIRLHIYVYMYLSFFIEHIDKNIVYSIPFGLFIIFENQLLFSARSLGGLKFDAHLSLCEFWTTIVGFLHVLRRSTQR